MMGLTSEDKDILNYSSENAVLKKNHLKYSCYEAQFKYIFSKYDRNQSM